MREPDPRNAPPPGVDQARGAALEPAGGPAVPAKVAPAACRCLGTGRIYAHVTDPKHPSTATIRTWMPIPCPRCRPEASPITPDGKMKSVEGRKAAAEARGRGL